MATYIVFSDNLSITGPNHTTQAYSSQMNCIPIICQFAMCQGDREYSWKDPCSKRANGLLQKPQSWLSLLHVECHINISTSSIFMFLTLKEISAIVSTFLGFLNFVYQFWYSIWKSTMIEHDISFIRGSKAVISAQGRLSGSQLYSPVLLGCFCISGV